MPENTFSFSGFRDGHCHPLFAAREGVGPNLDDCATVAAIQDRLREYRAANPDAVWIDCGSYEHTLAPEGRMLASWLDDAVADIPVVVHASDHHTIWVNSAALAVAGLTETAPTFKSASIDVDADGKPTGVLREWDAMSVVYAHEPKPSIDSDVAAIERAQERLLSHGIVAVQEAWIDPGMTEAYVAAVERGVLKLRVNLAPRIAPDTWRKDLEQAKAARSLVRAAGTELLTCNTVKIFIDGVFSSGTALLTEPYCAGGHGDAIWETEELHALALAADSAGFQLHFHAIGDAAVSMALDAVDHVDLCNGFVDRRPVIAHAELVSPEDMARMRRFGVIVCQQPVWIQRDEQFATTEAAIGAERAGALYPIANLLNERVTVSFGSDWPVSDPNPLPGLVNAVTRGASGSIEAIAPQEAITASQAVYAYSAAAAYQMGQESILAQDEVVLDTDITAADTATAGEIIGNAKVLSVRVAGKLVWSAA
jgi:predicted amidohydrolase YtcJ